MKNFRETKRLRNVLEGLKSNVGIFKGPFTYLTLNFIYPPSYLLL